MDDLLPTESSIEDLAKRFDEKLRIFREQFFREKYAGPNEFELRANQAQKHLQADVQEFGEPPEGYAYAAERDYLIWNMAAEFWKLHPVIWRASIIQHLMKEQGNSLMAFAALERVIISDHERRKVEKRHKRGVKARFQADAIKKWQSGRYAKIKYKFSMDYRDWLKAEHNVTISYIQIMDDWLKGH